MINIKIDPGIFEMFPAFRRGVVVALGVDNSRDHSELSTMLRDAENGLRIIGDSLLDDPRIDCWREAYRRFGSNPKDFPPSIELLLKSVSKGRTIRQISSLVDVFNIISMESVIPCGGDDLDAVIGPVVLGFATGSESYSPLGSPSVARNPRPGEVIYFDAGSNTVLCRSWNWKNADQTKIQLVTRNVAINVDAMIPPHDPRILVAATSRVAGLVRQYCGGDVTTHFLGPDQHELTM